MALEIKDLTKEQLLSKELIPQIFETYTDKEERNKILSEVLSVAKKHRLSTKIKREISAQKLEDDIIESGEIIENLTMGMNGSAEPTIDNYYYIITHDTDISTHIRYNLLSNKFEYWDNGLRRNWRDADDAHLLSYIETKYHFYNDKKYYQGLLKSQDFFAYHPIKDLIEREEWDGVPRIDKFLTTIMKCDDDDYSREVSRMIFYGGINRIYNPGCKFDYMVILIGQQGCNKSTIVNWLNISPQFYREVLSIDGSKGIESIDGGWVCEFAELLAMVRAKEVESLKGYITRLYDSYRPAYARNTVNLPRQCIFIGTTNEFQFLADKTGNRRYLPIEVHLKQGELLKNEKFVKNYIIQCWREAKVLMDAGKTYLVIPSEYNNLLLEHQDMAMNDDPKVGLIADYLDSKPLGYKVCSQELFVNCFNGIVSKQTTGTNKEIATIMQHFKNWKRVNSPIKFDKYGKQKYWVKNDEI